MHPAARRMAKIGAFPRRGSSPGTAWAMTMETGHRDGRDPCAEKGARLRTTSVRRVGVRVAIGLVEVVAGLLLVAALPVLAALICLGWLAAQPRRIVASWRDRRRHVPPRARPLPRPSGAT